MKRIKRLLCLLAAFCLLTGSTALAETRLYSPIAVVLYDQAALSDWTPAYGLNAPGVMLELSHPEGMLSVTALDVGRRTPEAYLSGRLDLAAETLAVSDAQILRWDDPFDGNGQQLTFSYTYPEGDEVHLCRIWAAEWNGMLIELSIDTWGEEAAPLMEAARAVFIEHGFTVTYCESAAELTATLSDVVEGDDGRVQIQLSSQTAEQFYPLAADAVVLFPNPDNPSLFYPVAPDMASLTDAILTFEDSSDSPPVFRAIIDDGQIVYMEHRLTM